MKRRQYFFLLTAALLILSLVASAGAHMPGAREVPEVELTPILIYDGDTLLEISIDDLAAYHGVRVGKGASKCVCLCCAFRAAEAAITELWGEEIPRREDIKIVTSLPTSGSMHAFQYITGTGPDMDTATRGEFSIVLPDGRDVANLSNKNIKTMSKDNSLENFVFTIHRRSTGESILISMSDGIFPDDYFDLRKKVNFNIPEPPDDEELDRFKSEWEDVRDAFLILPAWELFEGIEAPFPVGGAIFFVLLVTGSIILVVWMKRD